MTNHPEGHRLRRYNKIKQSVELRPPNPGKAITEQQPGMKIDPETLDLYSEIQPVSELITVMLEKFWLVANLEIPKLKKRKKLMEYGWGVTKTIFKMDLGQKYFHQKTSNNRQEDLSLLKKQIKEYARSIGYICGFTKIDRRFIANARDDKFPYDTAIVLGMEMDKDLVEQIPNPGDRLFDFEIYLKSGNLVFQVGQFIRSKGYRCSVRIPFDGWVKYPPHAINAGLGELGANGVVVTKEFGPRVRWAMISVDAEIEPDDPVDLNVGVYCDACRLCIKACPGGAIPDERLWWRGVLKRKINDTKCYPYFKKHDGCGLCIKVCPISRSGYEECMEAFNTLGKILRKKE